MVRMEALRNLPSRGGGFTRVGFGLEARDSDPASSPSPRLESPLDLPGVAYDSAGNLRGYVCDHNAAPPAHQYITTDKTNVLIRALTQKRSKDALAGRGAGASAAHAPRVPVGSSDHTQKPRGPPGLESRRGFFRKKRFFRRRTPRTPRTPRPGARRPPGWNARSARTRRRASHTNLTAGSALGSAFESHLSDSAERRAAPRVSARARVGGAAVAIAGKPQLLVRARTILTLSK